MSNKSVVPASDEIWSILKENSQQIKENTKGLKKAKELFETQWGRLMESLVEGDLVKILNETGIAVKNTYMLKATWRRIDTSMIL